MLIGCCCSNRLTGTIPERLFKLGENLTSINLNFNSECGHRLLARQTLSCKQLGSAGGHLCSAAADQQAGALKQEVQSDVVAWVLAGAVSVVGSVWLTGSLAWLLVVSAHHDSKQVAYALQLSMKHGYAHRAAVCACRVGGHLTSISQGQQHEASVPELQQAVRHN